LGALWFSPLLFGKFWLRILGKTEEDCKINPPKKRVYAYMFIARMVTAAFLIALFNLIGDGSLESFFAVAVFVWIGFVAMTSHGSYYFRFDIHSPFKLYLIENSYHLIGFLIVAIISYLFI
jgi:hypothetical protein